MTENEKKFVKAFVDFDSNLSNAQAYIKETYNVDSEFNSDDNTIRLYCKDGKLRAFDLVSAKAFINENFEEMMLTVVL